MKVATKVTDVKDGAEVQIQSGIEEIARKAIEGDAKNLRIERLKSSQFSFVGSGGTSATIKFKKQFVVPPFILGNITKIPSGSANIIYCTLVIKTIKKDECEFYIGTTISGAVSGYVDVLAIG